MWRRLAAVLVDLCSLAGVLALVTGGTRIKHSQVLPDFSLMWYGPYFLPLALCLLFDITPAGSRVVPWVRGWGLRYDASPWRRQRLLLSAAIAAAVLAHALVVGLRHLSFQTGMDLAIYANACRGALFSTMKGDVWLFADHFEPDLLLFTPLCRAMSPALALLAVQTLGWGVGAFGVHALARQQNYRPCLAALTAVAYLSFAGHASIAYYDFHLLSLTLALLPWLWWALAGKHYRWLVVFALAYLGLKESAAVSLAGLGLFMCVTARRDRAQLALGIAFLSVGLGTFIAILKFVYPAFRGGEGTMYFAKYYGHLGSSFEAFMRSVLTRPVYVASTLLTGPKLWYLCMLLAPFLFFPVYQPLYLLPVLPAILINALSSSPSLIGGAHHYDAEIYPALFAMAILAFASQPKPALWLATVLVLFSAESPLGVARWNLPTPAQRRLRQELAEHVPHDRAIAAPQRIAAHLTDRARLYMFDYWQMEDDWKRAELVVIGYHGERLGWYDWKTLQEKKLPRMLPRLEQVFQDPNDATFRMFRVLPQPTAAD